MRHDYGFYITETPEEHAARMKRLATAHDNFFIEEIKDKVSVVIVDSVVYLNVAKHDGTFELIKADVKEN